MSQTANSERGEAALVVAGQVRVLRPTFAALVAAEEELAALFWHCCEGRESIPRDVIGEAVMTMGLAGASAPLRELLKQILQGRT